MKLDDTKDADMYQIGSRTSKSSILTWLLLSLAVLAAYIFIFFSMTGGLINSGFLPEDHGFVQGKFLVYGLAAALVVVGAVFWMRFPYMVTSKKGLLVVSVLILPMLAVHAVEVFFTIAGVTYNAKADATLKALDIEVQKLADRAALIDADINAAFSNQLKVFIAREQLATIGKDGTNDARCGGICLDAINRQLELKQQYGAMSTATTTGVPGNGQKLGINAKFAGLTTTATTLKSRVAVYDQFALKFLAGNNALRPQFDTLQEDINLVGKRYFYDKGEVTSRSLVLMLTRDSLIAMYQGRLADITLWIAALVALMPLLVVFGSSLLMWQARERTSDAPFWQDYAASLKQTQRAMDDAARAAQSVNAQRASMATAQKYWNELLSRIRH